MIEVPFLKDYNMATVIFCAPQAWGKSRQARKLMAQFKCQRVVDDWQPGAPIQAGALHLTNVNLDLRSQPRLAYSKAPGKPWPSGVQVVSRFGPGLQFRAVDARGRKPYEATDVTSEYGSN